MLYLYRPVKKDHLVLEQKYTIDDITIKYKQKNRKYDTKHLIVVFSGFGSVGEFTYDLENVLQDCPAHVLWIKDDFNDHCSYYLCQGMDFHIEDVVNNFILKKLKELNLTKEDCTLIGCSKGGTAALYFGIKFQFKNILSSVPQFYIGSYIKKGWPAIASHMMGDVSNQHVERLNDILPKLINSDNNLDKNIYLLTSKADTQYYSEIEPNLSSFIKYKNFNLLLSKSILVREHNQVTGHHLPLILGIIYSLSQGATPHYGYSELGGDEYSSPISPSAEPLTVLKTVSIKNNRIYPEGISILRGLSCQDYKDIIIKLLFVTEVTTQEITLAKGHKPALTRLLYKDNYVNYDKGWFCTPSFGGFDSDIIANGEYQLFITVTCQGITKKNPLTVDAIKNNKVLAEQSGIKIYSRDSKVFLQKNSHDYFG